MPAPPVILAFDTSTTTGVVAVGRGARPLAVRHEPAPQAYDAGLLPHVAAALAEAGLGIADVDVVACGRGPGSFTGLRIALATAKGYAFALDRPLVLVSSSAAMAAAPRGRGPVVVVLDAKRGQVFAELFEHPAGSGGRTAPRQPTAREILDREALEPWILGRTGAARVALVGEAAAAPGLPRDPRLRTLPIRFPPAARLLALAARSWRAGATTPADEAEPDYVRPPPFHPPAGAHRGAQGSRGTRIPRSPTG